MKEIAVCVMWLSASVAFAVEVAETPWGLTPLVE